MVANVDCLFRKPCWIINPFLFSHCHWTENTTKSSIESNYSFLSFSNQYYRVLNIDLNSYSRLSHIFESHIVMGHYKKRYIKDISKCVTTKKQSSKPRPLNIADLSGSFLVLLLGSSISLLVFLIENIAGLRKRRVQASPVEERSWEVKTNMAFLRTVHSYVFHICWLAQKYNEALSVTPDSVTLVQWLFSYRW